MTDQETFVETADVVVISDDGHLLLIERDWPPYEGAWALPGGHIDPDEAPDAAGARELAEETGVPVAAADLVYIGRWSTPGRDPRGRYATTAYRTHVPAGTPIQADDDARSARWWPLNALPAQLAFDHADIIKAALSHHG